MPKVLTDSQGEFVIFAMMPGRYKIHAVRDEDGFGDTDFAFFGLQRPEARVVEIGENRTTSMTIDLGDPMGRVSADIVDVETKKALEKSRFGLSLADNPDVYVSSNPDENGHLVRPVPSVPIICEVTMPGYKTWRSDRIFVKSGDVTRLTAGLELAAR